MDKNKIDKKKFEDEAQRLGTKELNLTDKAQLNKAGFKFETVKLFNFYRKAKALIQCRKCEKAVRASVNLNGLKTSVEQAKQYCEDNMCKLCWGRIEKIK